MNSIKAMSINSPEKIASILAGLGVKSLFRFNERLYDEIAFQQSQIKVHDFYFDDGMTP